MSSSLLSSWWRCSGVLGGGGLRPCTRIRWARLSTCCGGLVVALAALAMRAAEWQRVVWRCGFLSPRCSGCGGADVNTCSTSW